MRAFLAVIALAFLCGCGVVGTPPTSPTPARPTPAPTATLPPLQQTAQAVQQQQRTNQYATQITRRVNACEELRQRYAQYGQVFDPESVRDPDRVLIELRLMGGGTGSPPTSNLGIQGETRLRGVIADCGGH